MHPRIRTSSTKYTTGKTRTPNAKYNYEPEDLGCIKFLYDLSTTTVDMLFAKYLSDPTSTPMTCVPLPSTLEDPVDPEHPRDMNNYFHYEMYHYRRQDREYLYRRRERLLPRHPRTTTSTTSRERLLPL